MKTIRLFICIVIVFTLVGCASTSKTPLLDEGQFNNARDVGIVLLSVGMHDKEPFLSSKHLPIISYDVYSLNNDAVINGDCIMTFDGEPRPDVYTNLRGHLDNGKYGFIHIAEMKAGKYLMIGRRRGSPGYALYTGGGGTMFIPGERDRYLSIYLTFEVISQTMNYIGEILTVSLDLNTENGININDEYERDSQFAYKKKPTLSQISTIKSLARKAYPYSNVKD